MTNSVRFKTKLNRRAFVRRFFFTRHKLYKKVFKTISILIPSENQAGFVIKTDPVANGIGFNGLMLFVHTGNLLRRNSGIFNHCLYQSSSAAPV